MKQYRDFYFRKAKQENYPARSIYKLKEIDKKYMLFSKGMCVLDLGAAPGSWSIGAAELVGMQGCVISCDIKDVCIPLPKNISFYKENIFQRSEEFENVLQQHTPFHIIMSDMAPQTTGTKFTDHIRSLELSLEAFSLARNYLGLKGSFITKVFMGPDINDLTNIMKQYFTYVKFFKPKSSRTESKEVFYIGLGFIT